MIVEIKDYTKNIHGTTVLDHINLTLKSGKIYGLRGENGSGKTMLMRAICGLILPSDGSISIDSEILGQDISFPRSLGALIENPAFLDEFTGVKNLQLIASVKNEINLNQIQSALTSVGLDSSDSRKYRKYSLGMKQRLGIACAIMEAPKLLILDEPFNALDESGIELIEKLLIKEKEKNTLIIIACHNHDELNKLSDEIFTISNGKIVTANDI